MQRGKAAPELLLLLEFGCDRIGQPGVTLLYNSRPQDGPKCFA
jgi:hypothetical protein